MNSRILGRNLLLLVALAAVACTAAFAGGPLLIYDPATKTPYSWAGGHANVYTDLGTLGPLTNEQADAMFAFSVDQWNAVPTSSFNGVIAGDVSALGLPDIDGTNLQLVLGTWNGGGVHVIYDADGSIMTAIFGGYWGVLGVTFTEWVNEGDPGIAEITMILNGMALPDWVTPEEAAAMYAGVTTHEFGHAIGLAHTQTNGQIVLSYDAYSGPAGCATPYDAGLTENDFETMYPFTSLSWTGIPESTVDILDDIAAVSDLYPAAGWPGNYPAISGTVYVPTAVSPRHTSPHGRPTGEEPDPSAALSDIFATAGSRDGGPGPRGPAYGPQHAGPGWSEPRHVSPVMGSNVIARNVANPYRDAISAISGNRTQGLAGVDGTYAFHGLTPGASYVVYVDGILYGAFSMPIPSVLPGPEEYWNGRQESGDGETDDRCAWTNIVPSARRKSVMDVTFNKVKGAPEFIPIDLPNSTLTEISGDGQKGVGIWDGGVFRWTPSAIEDLGGAYLSPQAGISHDGKTITASVLDMDGLTNAAYYTDATGWTMIGPGPDSSSCDLNLTSGWGVSNDGTVVGLDWLGCVATSAFKWNAATGWTDLGFLGSEMPGTRADRISADATTVVGWDRGDGGFWRGAMWRDGQETIFTQEPVVCCDWDPVYCNVSEVGNASAVNPDGSIVVGESYSIPKTWTDPDTGDEYLYCDSTSWKWTADGGVQPLGEFPGYRPVATDVSDDGSIVVGVGFPADWWSPRAAILWTEATGFMSFQDFLQRQGTWANDWSLMVAGTVSGDGKTFAGYGVSPLGYQGFVVRMPKVVMCHTTQGRHPKKRTIDVAWPEGFAAHLRHGDTIGVCGNGM